MNSNSMPTTATEILTTDLVKVERFKKIKRFPLIDKMRTDTQYKLMQSNKSKSLLKLTGRKIILIQKQKELGDIHCRRRDFDHGRGFEESVLLLPDKLELALVLIGSNSDMLFNISPLPFLLLLLLLLLL